MNPSTDSILPTTEAVEDAAAAWFWKRDSGDWSDADQAAFDAWLNGSTAHRVAYLRLRAGWKGAERMKALGAGIPRGEVPPPGHWGNDRFLGGRKAGRHGTAAGLPEKAEGIEAHASAVRAFKPLRWATAATLLLALGVTLFVQFATVLQLDQYSTPIGGLDTVPLPDGSRVTLNTDTRIRVDFSDEQRRIDLSKGEAFFDVAKDAARPFVVYVDDKRVTAVGTQFSVRRDEGDIRVVVTEGRVRLEREPVLPQLRKIVGTPAPPAATLAAGAIARTSKDEVLVQEGSAPQTEQLLSWRSGYLVFEATPLAEAVAEFNRYNTRTIVIDEPSLAALRIGGNFRSNNIDAFLWLLQSGFHVEIDEKDDSVHLSAR